MPQIKCYYDIIAHPLYVMSTVIQYKHDPSQQILVESEAKNPLSASISAMDMIGLTWIFGDEDTLEELK